MNNFLRQIVITVRKLSTVQIYNYLHIYNCLQVRMCKKGESIGYAGNVAA